MSHADSILGHAASSAVWCATSEIPGSDIFVYWGPFALTLSPTNGVYHPYINFLTDISALLVM